VKVCVYGAGAIGGSIAARLSASGAEVSVIARGAQLEAIRERGLVVLAGDARIEARVRAVADPAELGPQDLVVVAVKGHHLPSIARPLGRMLAAGAPAVFAMNGILWWFADGLPVTMRPEFADALDPGGELRRSVPAESIVGAVVNSANEAIEPGVIRNTSPERNRLVLGAARAASAETAAAVRAIAAFFVRAGYEAPIAKNIREAIWSKLALYIAVSSVAALTHRALDRLVADREARGLMATLMREAIAVGDALGFTHRADVDAQLDFFRDKPTRPSLLQDFEQGREPELAGTLLAAQGIARAIPIAVPCIDMVATLLRLKAAGDRVNRMRD